jgi:hypothetical protein
MRVGFLLLGLILSACGGGGGSSSVSSGSDMDFSVSTTPANSTLSVPFVGHTKVMVGFSGNSNAGDQAPFDMQYQYLNSGSFSSYDHAGCMSGTVSTSSCSSWWGAWQEDVAERGLFATRFINTAKARTWNSVSRAQIPYFTYYMLLPASGLSEGVAETDALDDQTFLTSYFDDWRFLLQKIGNEQAMLHIEPDLFGYLKARDQPSAIPAKVTQSNPTDCSGYDNNATGFSKCMIQMVRSYAPNAMVGLHVSPWTHTSSGDADSWANFMIALGADQGDFLVTDPSDRDADWYRLVQGQPGHDWDIDKMTAFLQWTKDVSTAVGKPFFLWQLPLGNSYQDNSYQHYKDHRVELLFSHIAEVRDAHVIGMLFGSGETAQTNVQTDGGLLIGKTKQHYISRGGD